MKANEFIEKLKLACSVNTIYCKGGFGDVITDDYIDSMTSLYPGWYNTRKDNLKTFAHRNEKWFAFDCIGLIKGCIWGWDASTKKAHGGAKYASNNMPDTTEIGILNLCSNVSDDFTNIIPGEYLYMNGHAGVYIGDGKVIESTPAWDNGVQVTMLRQRSWLKHGKLNCIDYGNTNNVSRETITQNTNNTKKESGEIKMLAIKKGSKGIDVSIFESIMAKAGYYPGDIDGSFGPQCDSACRNFQRDNGLDVDGSCGPKTWACIISKMK